MAEARITFTGFAVRWFAALLLVMGTINPSGAHYISWLFVDDGLWSLKLLVGLMILVGFVIYLRATFVSITKWGVLLGILLFMALFWIAYDLLYWLVASGGFIGWFVVVAAATIMAVGMSWSYVRRILSGQVDNSSGGQ